MRIVSNPRFPAAARLALAISAGGVPPQAELIYDGGRNRVYKLEHEGMEVCVKAFKVPNLINRVAYATVRKSKARRAYEHALRLIEMGFASPTPLAWIEDRRGLCLGRSYYVCAFSQGQTMRDWERKPDADPLLKAFAAEMARLHAAGVWHKDFSPGNILYTGDAASGYAFSYVDINRMAFGVRSRSKLMRCFRSIHLDEEETARLARLYAQAAGLDPGAVELQAREQSRAYKQSKRRLRSIKGLLRRKNKYTTML